MSSLVSSKSVEQRERSITSTNEKKHEQKEDKQLTKKEAVEKLATHILSFEGGYANHKLDRPTNRGVQWLTYKKYARRLKLDTSRVAFRNLTESDAKKFIYLFWQLANVDSIKDKRIAVFFVEEFWASPVSIKFYQQKINQVYSCKLLEDGGMGKEMVVAINSINFTVLIPKLIQWKEERYKRIVQRSPKKRIFSKGWQKRRSAFNKLFLN